MFKRKGDLQKHQRVHTNNEIVNCPNCSKPFKKKNLNKHIGAAKCDQK